MRKSSVKNLSLAIVIAVTILGSTACRNSPPNSFSSSSSSDGLSTPSKPAAATTNAGLTDSKVETAVNAMLADWRLGGNVRVRGVQELPQQNSAIADLQFAQFEYGVTYEGGIIKAKDFKPKPIPQGRDRLPSMDEMFPQKKAVYSKDGKAILSRYTDGRWVLKEVRWGFDTGIKGTIEIR